MPYKYCQHVKENGILCGSPSLRGRNYCYYHGRTRARRLAMAKARSERRPWRLDLPPLEDMYAVQAALSNVIEALAARSLDPKLAGLILYGLQQAASNLRLPVWGFRSHYAVGDDNNGRVDNYPGLEDEFGLEKSFDLDAVPDEAFPPPFDPWEYPVKKPVMDAEGLRIWKDVLADQERKILAESSIPMRVPHVSRFSRRAGRKRREPAGCPTSRVFRDVGDIGAAVPREPCRRCRGSYSGWTNRTRRSHAGLNPSRRCAAEAMPGAPRLAFFETWETLELLFSEAPCRRCRGSYSGWTNRTRRSHARLNPSRRCAAEAMPGARVPHVSRFSRRGRHWSCCSPKHRVAAAAARIAVGRIVPGVHTPG